MEEERRKMIESRYDQEHETFKTFCSKLINLVEELIKTKGIPYQSITSRVKDKLSYLNKCQKDKYSDPENEIMDVIGIRIIAYINSDVKKICNLIEREFYIDRDNSINKADQLEENQVGYLSVHYIAKLKNPRAKLPEYISFKDIRFEIQVRTLLQHAWAEIEHDRNYKFGGVLPSEIRRRFFLAAGILEMVDREFQNISTEITHYSNEMKVKPIERILSIPIDSTSLYEYMSRKFRKNYIEATLGKSDKIIIEELNKFGIVKIEDIEKHIPKDYIEILEKLKLESTYLGVLRNMMIIDNHQKYFDDCWQNNWDLLSADTEKLLEYYKIPINQITEKYEISLESDLFPFEQDDDYVPFEPDDDSLLFEPDDDYVPFEPDDDSVPFEPDDDSVLFEQEDKGIA